MNNINENINIVLELSKQIEQLRQENYELRQEIARLRSQEIKSNENVANDTALIEYYISRYEEIHDYVLENRVKIIDDEITKAQNSYDHLASREDMLGEIAERNQAINKEIELINQQINENNELLESKKAAFEEYASSVTYMENNLFLTTLDYYNNILVKLSLGNVNETLEYVNFVMDVLKYTMYNEVVKYKQEAISALEILDELTDLETSFKNEKSSLNIRKNELEESIEIISFEETEKKLDNLAYEIANKKEVREELLNLFDNLKKQNIKLIQDEARHYRLLDLSNQEIASKLDDIVMGYKTKLMNVDTNSNILLNKKTHLSKLNAEMEAIYLYKEEYDNANEEYNQLQLMHQTISNNIEEVENYIEGTKKILDSNIAFKKIINEYEELKNKMDALKENLDSYILREKNLVEARKQVLNDPYGKTDLIRINEELKQLQESMQLFNNEYLSLQTKLYSLKETEQDYKLVTIYEEYKICEKQLPSLYEKQRNLSSMINDKYIKVSALKMKCANYDELARQIEELEDEIKNF